MENIKVRDPVQKRSIEKKNKIIKIGFRLICEKGYHNTNTVEIAKEAGVSTGIVYSYFKDKKDIFLNGLSLYTEDLMRPVFTKLSSFQKDSNINSIVREFVNSYIETHIVSKYAHEELTAMSHLDEDVAKFFYQFEIQMGNRIITFLEELNLRPEHVKEKVHTVIGLIENLCHEIVYHKHKDINYDIMTEIVVNTTITLLT